jgi:predicted RNA-binding Zn-ribbon protein involved in translation (DUF1610 family)
MLRCEECFEENGRTVRITKIETCVITGDSIYRCPVCGWKAGFETD